MPGGPGRAASPLEAMNLMIDIHWGECLPELWCGPVLSSNCFILRLPETISPSCIWCSVLCGPDVPGLAENMHQLAMMQ